jgi:hypothetical protein
MVVTVRNLGDLRSAAAAEADIFRQRGSAMLAIHGYSSFKIGVIATLCQGSIINLPKA